MNVFLQGNYPDSVVIEATCVDDKYPQDVDTVGRDTFTNWQPLLPASKLRPHDQHKFSSDDLQGDNKISHVRVKMFPDGGISRLRIFGTPSN